MNDVVYLFGAGASAEVMPLVSDMPKRMLNVVDLLTGDTRLNTLRNKTLDHLQVLEVADKLKDLAFEAMDHASIDTVAKKYLIRSDMPRYYEISKLLCFYLSFEQMLFRLKVDKRYDSFFATILDRHGRPPKNMILASWNYDAQLELAYSAYLRNQDPDSARYALNYSSPFVPSLTNPDQDDLIFHKINGTVGYRTSRGIVSDLVDYSLGFTEENVERMINNCFQTNVRVTLSYAWDDGIKTERFNSLSERIRNARQLVVAGYSFPYFNRKIDIELFAMANYSEVIIQDPNAETIKNTLESMLTYYPDKPKFTVIEDREVGFHIPNQFT